MRYFRYLFVLFLVIVPFIFLKEDKKSRIISFSNNQNQLINDNEIIRIPFLMNQNDLPITNSEMIKKISLKDENNEVPCELLRIKSEDYLINYIDEDYYAYMYDLVLENKTPKYNLKDALLEFTLTDGSVYEFEVGDFNLDYGELNNFYLTYLDSRSTNVGEFYTVKEVVVGIKAINDIRLNRIDIEENLVKIENNKIKVFDSLEEVKFFQENKKLDGLIYDDVSEENLDILIRKDEIKYLVIPLTYIDKTYLNRFFLKLTTNYGTEYIDDFLYLNQGFFPEFVFINKHEYTY